jgi:hypothetical protein
VKDNLVEPERHPVWKQLGESDALRRQKYRQIINNEKEAASEEPDFKDLKKGIAGDDEFRKYLRNSLGRLRARLKITWAFAGEYFGWIIMVRKRSPDLVGSRDDERHKRPEERQPPNSLIQTLPKFKMRSCNYRIYAIL